MTILAGHQTLLQVLTPSRGLPSIPDPLASCAGTTIGDSLDLEHNNRSWRIYNIVWILILRLTCLKRWFRWFPPLADIEICLNLPGSHTIEKRLFLLTPYKIYSIKALWIGFRSSIQERTITARAYCVGNRVRGGTVRNGESFHVVHICTQYITSLIAHQSGHILLSMCWHKANMSRRCKRGLFKGLWTRWARKALCSYPLQTRPHKSPTSYTLLCRSTWKLRWSLSTPLSVLIRPRSLGQKKKKKGAMETK